MHTDPTLDVSTRAKAPADAFAMRNGGPPPAGGDGDRTLTADASSPAVGAARPEVVVGAPSEALQAPAAGATAVITETVIEPATTDPGRPLKVIVAVHGIGDQHSYSTIQAVVEQFCAYQGHPGGVSLGSFHNGRPAFAFEQPFPAAWHQRFAFAEVYWADQARAVEGSGYTLEETTRWARSIVGRLRLRWKEASAQGGLREVDFPLVNRVLAEMIQAVTVLDRLCYLADRAGLFTFELKKLLDGFLGDVQIVTEFRSQREKILAAFDDVMRRIHADHPGPETEIYVVAHSEGTVVAFLALLAACRADRKPAWLDQVRGLMTLGSPLDKHLVLWPGLFDGDPPAHAPAHPIEWRNYYDHGDPVGFALDDTRAWIETRGKRAPDDRAWEGVFHFRHDAEVQHDFGFARYPLPGKAHVDYWTDPAVFGHFLQTVMHEPPIERPTAAADYSAPPASRWWVPLVSYALPYCLVSALVFAAAFVLVKAVQGAVTPAAAGEAAGGAWEAARRAAGIAALMFGTTAVARVRALTRHLGWRAAAAVVGVLGAATYLGSVGHAAGFLGWLAGCVGLGSGACAPVLAGTEPVLVAAVVLAAAYVVGAVRPAWKTRPLIILGTGAAAVLVGRELQTASAAARLGPVWPVFFATAAFFYLWWLAALLFDLAFVWHRYIRHAALVERMDAAVGRTRRPQPAAGWTRRTRA